MRRLLMYSQDGMGLGHLRRSWNIAQAVLRQAPDTEIVILADSPAASLVCLDQTIECVKLPTLVKMDSTTWRNGVLSSSAADVVKMRSELILNIFRGFAPDTVLVDHMPVGALGELKPLLDHCRALASPPRLFLGLRDVLDGADVIRRTWRDLGAYGYLPDYESILIYGSQDIYDATAAYGLLPAARRVLYCNYVAPLDLVDGDVTAPTGDAACSVDPFVLMMGGGGHDAFSIADAFLTIGPDLWQAFGLRTVLLTGPNMAPTQREALLARGNQPSVRVEAGVGDAAAWISEASVILTMAGYNSLCELVARGKKALVVPRSGPSLEQRTRSRLFADRGLIRLLDPDHLTPERLRRDIGRLLDEEGIPDTRQVPLLDGAARAAVALVGGTREVAPRGVVIARLPSRLNGSQSTSGHGWLVKRLTKANGAPQGGGGPSGNGHRSGPLRAEDAQTGRLDPPSLGRFNLPMLPSALDADGVDERLRELLFGHAAGLPLPPVEAASLVTARPGRRALLAYDLGGGLVRLLGKHFRDPVQAQRVFRTMTHLRSETFRGKRRLGVPRPLGVLPELSMVVYVPVDGRPLGHLLSRSDATAPIRRTARWLAHLHGSHLPLDRRLGLAHEVDNAGDWGGAVAGRFPERAAQVDEVVGRLRDLAADLDPRLDVPIHKDFHPGHVIVRGERLSVIDFDEMRLGDPAADLAHFCAYLRLDALRSGRPHTDLERTFLDEYARRAAWDDEAGFTTFFVYTCLKIARQLTERRGTGTPDKEKGRRRLVEGILAEALAGPACLTPTRRLVA